MEISSFHEICTNRSSNAGLKQDVVGNDYGRTRFGSHVLINVLQECQLFVSRGI